MNLQARRDVSNICKKHSCRNSFAAAWFIITLLGVFPCEAATQHKSKDLVWTAINPREVFDVSILDTVEALISVIYIRPDAMDPKNVASRVNQVSSLIQMGTPFEKVAQTCSQDSSSARVGGQLYWAPRSRYAHPLDSLAFAMRADETRGPIMTPWGWFFVKHQGYRFAFLTNTETSANTTNLDKTTSNPKNVDIETTNLNQNKVEVTQMNPDTSAGKTKGIDFKKIIAGALVLAITEVIVDELQKGSEPPQKAAPNHAQVNNYAMQLAKASAPSGASKDDAYYKKKLEELKLQNWNTVTYGKSITKSPEGGGIFVDRNKGVTAVIIPGHGVSISKASYDYYDNK